MKKHLLFTTGIFVTGLLCAQVNSKIHRLPAHLANQAMNMPKLVPENNIQVPAPVKPKFIIPAKSKAQRVSALTESVIGNTVYDLQSNGSVGDRIVVNANGSIAATWIHATGDLGTYADRGTGYNYFNGTAWGAPPTARIEADRVGWGVIANTRSGNEIVLAHGLAAYKMNHASRPVAGTGSWTNSSTAFPTVSIGSLWPRIVTSNPTGGDTVYAISLSTPSGFGGSAYNGLDGALLFSRSTNAGATWDIVNQQPAGFTSANFLGIGGDGYAMAAKGATIAIIAGDSGTDLILSKSTDGGVTWTATTVYKFPLTLWDQNTLSDIHGDGIADRIETNDGNLSIALDNNGKAFVAYGRMRILTETPNTPQYLPYTDGLYMWNEGMPAFMGDTIPGTHIIAGMEDMDGDGEIMFPSVPDGVLPFGQTRSNSLTSFPSLAFDASNTMYLSYSSVVENLGSIADATKLVRHVYVTKSCDEGLNWTAPYDIDPNDPDLPQEGLYASMAKNVDGNVHLVYQRDFYPGNGIPAAAGQPANPDGDQLDQNNQIVYVKLPVADLPTCSVITGIKDASSVSGLSFYPNPASTNGTIDIVLKENAKMEIVVMNAVGQKMYSTTVDGNVGSNKVDVNLSNLSNGMYFYQVKIANNKAITNKFVVGK